MRKIIVLAFFALIFSGVKAQEFHKLGPQNGDPIMYFLNWEPTADPMVKKAYEETLPMLGQILDKKFDLAVIVAGEGFTNHGINSKGIVYSVPLKVGTRCLAWRLDKDSDWQPFAKIGDNWCFNPVTSEKQAAYLPATTSGCDPSKIVKMERTDLTDGTIILLSLTDCGEWIKEVIEPNVQIVKEEVIVQTEKVIPFSMTLHSGSLVGPETAWSQVCQDQGKTKIKTGPRFISVGFGLGVSTSKTQTYTPPPPPRVYTATGHSQGAGSNGSNTTTGGNQDDSNGSTTTTGETLGGDNGSGTLLRTYRP